MEGRSLASIGAFRELKIVGILFASVLFAGVVLLAGEKIANAQEDLFEPTEEIQNPRDLDKGCTPTQVPVEITGVEYEIYGELCLPLNENGKPYTPETVQMTLHGIMYGTYYWDFPDLKGSSVDENKENSYVDYMTNAGYATFNIDRIGIGRSDHPPSAQVTLETNGMVASQLVQKLRGEDEE